jgi:hypothetical protein
MGVEFTIDESAPLPLACAVRQVERTQIHILSAKGVGTIDSAFHRSGVVRLDLGGEWELAIAARCQHRDLDIRASERTGHDANKKSDDQVRFANRRSPGTWQIYARQLARCTVKPVLAGDLREYIPRRAAAVEVRALVHQAEPVSKINRSSVKNQVTPE